jgi:hypothetical protein
MQLDVWLGVLIFSTGVNFQENGTVVMRSKLSFNYSIGYL